MLYITWVGIVFTVSMIVLLPGLTLPFLFGNKLSWLGYTFLKIWSWVFSMLTFIRYEFYGREHFRSGQSYIYVSNHTSFLDLPGLAMFLPGEFRPLAKKELLKIPIFGWIARGAAVIVDRSSGESRKRSMDKLKEHLEHGTSILLFAEGTQNRSQELLQPFKDGAFRIAMEMQTPILPMVILGAGRLMPPGTINLRPGKIRIYATQEIDKGQFTSIAHLKEKTFNTMKTLITSHVND